MGANASTWQDANGSSLTQKNPQVTAFHSSAKWKAHFEASKQTTKLVEIVQFFFFNSYSLSLFLNSNSVHLKIVIDFTATWCGPCQYIEPAIYEFAAKYTDVEFVKIDVDELEVG